MGSAFFLLAPLELPFPVTWYNADEGFILYKSYLVSMGKTPYVDFDPFWPPLVYYLNGLLFKMFGVRIMVAKYGLAVVGLLGAISMFAVASKIMPRWIAVLCSTSFIFCGPPILNVPYSSWYTVPIGLAGLYAVFTALERESILPVLLAGIAAGLAFSFKQSIGVFVGASFAVMGLFWRESSNADPPATNPAARVAGPALILLACAGLPVAYVATRTISNLLFLTLPALVAGALVIWIQERSAGWDNRRSGPQSLKGLIRYETVLSAGFVLAVAPWFGCLAAKIGFFRTLKSVLLLGESWRLSKMAVPFPHVNVQTLIFPGLLIALFGAARLLCDVRRSRRSLLLWGSVLSIQSFFIFSWVLRGSVWRYFLSRSWDIDVFMFVPPVAIVCYMIFVIAHARGKDLSREGLFSLCLFIFSALLLQQSYPFVDLNHFTFGFAPWIILCFFLAYRLALRLRRDAEESPKGLASTTLLLVAPLLIFFAGRTLGPARLLVGTEQNLSGWSLKKRDIAYLNVEGSEIIFDAAYSRMFAEVAKYLKANTQPTDKITGLPSLAIFNVLTKRQTPTKFVYMWPGYFSREEVRRTAEEIRGGKPKYVIISNAPSSPGDVFSYRYYAQEYPEIASVVEELYEPEKTIGCFTVMRPKSKSDGG